MAWLHERSEGLRMGYPKMRNSGAATSFLTAAVDWAAAQVWRPAEAEDWMCRSMIDAKAWYLYCSPVGGCSPST